MDINYVSMVVAVIAATALGFLWYGPSLFGKAWMVLMGYTEKELKKEQAKMGPMYVLNMGLTFLTAFVLQKLMILSMSANDTSMAVNVGLSSALWLWVGIVAPVQATRVTFGKDTWQLFWINTGYQLCSLLLMGLIMGVMR